MRLLKVKEEEPHKKIHIRYFGDKDPSGDDMDRDIVERIERLTGWKHGREFDFKRIAVTFEQIQRYNLPPMPTDAKTKKKYEDDPRKDKYEKKNNGLKIAVELEALSIRFPDDYKKMIQDAANEYYEPEIYSEEIKKRSTPEFRREVRQEVYNQVSNFVDRFIVDDVDDAETSDTSGGDDDTSDTSDSDTSGKKDEE